MVKFPDIRPISISGMTLLCWVMVIVPLSSLRSQNTMRPNIIMIITDDQGFGDFGFTGNPHVLTPHLDRLASESIYFTNFHVSPVCAPTRSSLMTGRYSLRTGVHDTYNGGAIMATEEVTIAEVLSESGYRTGIFGKWHLGDNYPSRPRDQGFETALIHLSGGMGQVGDFTTYFQGDSSYFNPILWLNDQTRKYEGYCSDIFTTAAIDFIVKQHEQPFFCYLSFNAPHTPLQVPGTYLDRYGEIDPSKGFEEEFPELQRMTERDKDAARKVYAMVDNIDENIGRLLMTLDSLNLSDNTWIFFLSDNGPQQIRYNGGMRGRKGSVYRGGIRVPLLVRPPDGDTTPRKTDFLAAHIDIAPTIAELCQVHLPEDRIIDGQSLISSIIQRDSIYTDRYFFSYWSRRFPEKYHNISLQTRQYKLLGHTDYDSPINKFELYDLDADPAEQNNLVMHKTALAQTMKARLDSFFNALLLSQHLHEPPLIFIGHAQENPVILNRNDAAGERGIWSQDEIYGYWNVQIQPGIYDVRFRFLHPINTKGRMILETGPQIVQKSVEGHGQVLLDFNEVVLPAITRGQLTAFLEQDGRHILPFWIELKKRE